MPAPTRRDRLRAETLDEIKTVSLSQLREVGAAQLSLRAVAAALGMSPAGLYRYFDSRDALLTALITDAFDRLADAVERARDADPAADVADRLFAALAAYRRWAVEHPQEFGLIYGTPVPGYAAPPDGPTSVATRRVGGAFAPLFVEAWQQGRLRQPDEIAPDPALARYAAELHPGLPPAVAAAVLGVWTRLHGLVVFEAFGHLRWLGHDTAALAEQQLLLLLAEIGLRPGSGAG
ncbi:TetR/AcrR family transcriptional regulator [Streptomyces albipurpureus]|uniref:TetR/AcrR family transcriptional regulator n=1 Tax=Streptomyces albipurpureus TaxID=2897419 RepID=A0ABT0UH49_9ACTN|nr:TetR/AcrR family transcriptional regulator [Streptomyces sp. CWNU-1]MCM2387646.1 TetR/AcrR family transcriptional regulator [Streptomyces sp. CWNU-1]